MEGGRAEGSNLLSRALFKGGWPAVRLERSEGGGGEERFAGETVGATSEVIFTEAEDLEYRTWVNLQRLLQILWITISPVLHLSMISILTVLRV